MAQDVQGFITALDLYVHPLALVGAGTGAIVALTLAAACPPLIGALALLEFTLPAPIVEVAASDAGSGAAEGTHAVHDGCVSGGNSSLELLPWWGFHPAQAATFYSGEECAAFLCHPLANLSPAVATALATAAAAAQQADSITGHSEAAAAATGDLQQLLGRVRRSPQGAARSAVAMLPPASMAAGWGPAVWLPGEGPAEGGLWPTRTDARLLFSFDPPALAAALPALPCHLLLLTGAPAAGGWCTAEDAAAMARAATGAASTRAAMLPAAGHRLATDAPEGVLEHLLAFLEGPALWLCHAPKGAAGGTSVGADAQQLLQQQQQQQQQQQRRPELLGLRPLPQYASLEEARRALGPRAPPAPEAVAAELAALRLAEGRAADADSDEEEAGQAVPAGEAGGGAQRRLGRYQTALAQNPPDYFGFIG